MKASFLFGILLIIAGSAYSQKKTSNEVMNIDLSKPRTNSITIEIDSPNAKSVRLISMPTSRTLSVRLLNANPFKYRYTIDAKPISYFQGTNPFDTLLRKFDGANFQNNNSVANLDDTINAKKHSFANVAHTIDSPITKDKKKTSMRKYISAYNVKREFQTPTDKSELRLFNKEVLTAINDYMRKSSDTTNISIDTLNAILDRVDADVAIKIAQENHCGDSVVHKAFKLWMKTRTVYENMLSYENTIKAEDYLMTDSFNKYIQNLSNQYDTIIKEYVDLYEKVNYNTDSFHCNELDSIKKWLPRTISNLKSGRNYLNGMQLEYFTLPIDINGSNIDALEVSVKRNGIRNTTLEDKYTYKVWIRGGVKIDASAGIFLTSLVDKQYIARDVPDTTAKTIFEKNTGNLAFGFGSMLNLSYRNGARWVRPSLNFGILFTTTSSQQKFQFLSGLGIVVGKEQRMIFHFGAAFGTHTVLQNGYVADGKTLYNLGASNTVPTDEKFDVGYYYGLTYNISKPKVQKSGISEN